MKRVECFVKRWNYSYAESLRMVADRVRNPLVESLLNRFGNSIEAGIPDEAFLTEELETVRNVYLLRMGISQDISYAHNRL